MGSRFPHKTSKVKMEMPMEGASYKISVKSIRSMLQKTGRKKQNNIRESNKWYFIVGWFKSQGFDIFGQRTVSGEYLSRSIKCFYGIFKHSFACFLFIFAFPFNVMKVLMKMLRVDIGYFLRVVFRSSKMLLMFSLILVKKVYTCFFL